MKKRPTGSKREWKLFIRLSDEERARYERQAGREPLATWARRILTEYVERRERRGKGR